MRYVMVTHLAQGDVIGGREGWGVGQGQCWEGGGGSVKQSALESGQSRLFRIQELVHWRL